MSFKPFTCSFEISRIDDAGVWTPVRKMDNIVLMTGYNLIAEMVSSVRNINFMYLAFTNASVAPTEFLINKTRPRSYYDNLVDPEGYCRVPVKFKEYYTAGKDYQENVVVFSTVIEGGSQTGADLQDSVATVDPLDYCSWFHTVSLASVSDVTDVTKDVLYNAATFRDNNVFSPIPKIRGSKIGITASIRFVETPDAPLQLWAGDILNVTMTAPTSSLNVDFSGTPGESATLIINGVTKTFSNVNGSLVLDLGLPDEYVYTYPGQATQQTLGGVPVQISVQGAGCMRLGLLVWAHPSSSSAPSTSSSSSSSAAPTWCCAVWEVGWKCSLGMFTEPYLAHPNPYCSDVDESFDWTYDRTENPDFCYYQKNVCVLSGCGFDIDCGIGTQPVNTMDPPTDCRATYCATPPSSSSSSNSSSSAMPSSSSSGPSSSSGSGGSSSSGSSSSHGSTSSTSSSSGGPHAVQFQLPAGWTRVGGGELYQIIPYDGYAEEPILTSPADYVQDGWDHALGPITTDVYMGPTYSHIRFRQLTDRPTSSSTVFTAIDADFADDIYLGVSGGSNWDAEVWRMPAGTSIPVFFAGLRRVGPTSISALAIPPQPAGGSMYAVTDSERELWQWTSATGFIQVTGVVMHSVGPGEEYRWHWLVADSDTSIYAVVRVLVSWQVVRMDIYRKLHNTGVFTFMATWDEVSPIAGRYFYAPPDGRYPPDNLKAVASNQDSYRGGYSDFWMYQAGGTSPLIELNVSTGWHYRWIAGVQSRVSGCVYILEQYNVWVTNLSGSRLPCFPMPSSSSVSGQSSSSSSQLSSSSRPSSSSSSQSSSSSTYVDPMYYSFVAGGTINFPWPWDSPGNYLGTYVRYPTPDNDNVYYLDGFNFILRMDSAWILANGSQIDPYSNIIFSNPNISSDIPPITGWVASDPPPGATRELELYPVSILSQVCAVNGPASTLYTAHGSDETISYSYGVSYNIEKDTAGYWGLFNHYDYPNPPVQLARSSKTMWWPAPRSGWSSIGGAPLRLEDSCPAERLLGSYDLVNYDSSDWVLVNSVSNSNAIARCLSIASAYVSRVQVYMARVGYEVHMGLVYAKIYNVAGNPDDRIPVGQPIAISDPLPFGTLETAHKLVEFIFSTPVIISGNIAISIEADGMPDGHAVVGTCASGACYRPAGNNAARFSGTWVNPGFGTPIFYLYGYPP